MAANDVIPFSLFRQMIQDNPKDNNELLLTDGETKVFQLSEFPILFDAADPDKYPFTIKLNTVDTNNTQLGTYVLNCGSGKLRFETSPPVGSLEIDYLSTQLTDAEIEMCLNNALTRHDNTATWNAFPPEYAPYVMWLAAASAFYMLAAKWATEVRIKVETVEIHNNRVGGSYFDLGKRMEDRYEQACAGVIQVNTLTRRDVATNLLIPLPEDVYGL